MAAENGQAKEPLGEYVAKASIDIQNVRAFNVGDLVPTGHVRKYQLGDQVVPYDSELGQALTRWHRGETWTLVTGDDLELPEHLSVRVRLEQAGTRMWASGVMVEREDRGPVHARDLRLPFVRKALETAATLHGAIDTRARQPKPPRPGPAGHPDAHWHEVYRLWIQAQVEAPQRPIAWMCEHWEPPVPSATMRRWRDRAVTVAGSGRRKFR